MDTPLAEIGASALFAFVVGAALFPRNAVLWDPVTAVIGNTGAAVLMTVAYILLGMAFVAKTGVELSNLAAGTLVAYVVGMGLIELHYDPTSPAHFIVYALFGVLFVLGAGAASIARYREAIVRLQA